MLRRSSALLVLTLLVSLAACGSDDGGRDATDATTSTSAAGRPAQDDGACDAWQAFLADGDSGHLEDLLGDAPTAEVAKAARELLANLEPETVEGQDAHEVDVDVITAALGCGDAALTAAATAYLATDDACEPDLRPDADPGLTGVLVEGSGTTIATVVCRLAAYQEVYELHGWDGTSLSDLALEQWVDGAVRQDPIVVGSPYVEDDGRIANVDKGRGLGDCGTYQAWVLDGARLVLDEAREKAACDERSLPVEDWPVVYRR